MTEGIGLAPQGFFIPLLSPILRDGEVGSADGAILLRRVQ